MEGDAMSTDEQQGSLRDRIGWLLRNSRLAVLMACLLVAGSLFLGSFGVIHVFWGIPVALLLIWLLLWLSHTPWSDLGLRRPASWGRALALGTLMAVLLQLSAVLVIMPLVHALGGELPDISRFEPIRGNWPAFLIFLAVAWTTAGLGEEIIFRGYLLNRTAWLFGGSRAAWTAGVVVTSAVFGSIHLYQGPTGVATTAFAGLVLCGLFLASRRNLWLPILTHAMMNTINAVLFFTGFWQDFAARFADQMP
jgi:membrane protease YdiL (CAAX protease family)